MERLTHKTEDWYWKDEEFWISAENPSLEKIDDVYYKLAEIEDILEQYEVPDTEKLKETLKYNVTDFKDWKWKDIYEELLDTQKTNSIIKYLMKIKRENGTLKTKWKELKDFVKRKQGRASMCEIERMETLEEIEDKIDELEKEE